jgi:hypothetical protein
MIGLLVIGGLAAVAIIIGLFWSGDTKPPNDHYP